jgi:hypothetical protein
VPSICGGGTWPSSSSPIHSGRPSYLPWRLCDSFRTLIDHGDAKTRGVSGQKGCDREGRLLFWF